MTCRRVRDALLEADLSELRLEGESPLVLHLRGCPRCRAAAERILTAEEELAGALARSVPHPDADAVLAGARTRRGARRWTGALRARWPALLPLAAAAVLVLLLLAREGPPPPAVAVLEETAPGIQLEVSSGRPVAVIETEDADITVVWIF